jgi:lipoprotein signal peptidase
MIETSRRGRVCDYLCLRFWPAFNLADAAISIGAVGFVVTALVNVFAIL